MWEQNKIAFTGNL